MSTPAKVSEVLKPLLSAGLFQEEGLGHFPLRTSHVIKGCSFALTISEAQGQSLQACELNLEDPCFTVGHYDICWTAVFCPLTCRKPFDLFVYTYTRWENEKCCVY